MTDPRSLYEQIDDAVSNLGALIEALGCELYKAVEAEALKRVAVLAGVDHTREGTVVLGDIAAVLVRERDMNRELRRQIAALNRKIEGSTDGDDRD